MNKIIAGSLESIDQMITFIEGLNDMEYQYCAKPWFDSSIGQHLRHIVDLYTALINKVENETVNYDVRRRGAPIETIRQTGLNELFDIRNWMTNIPAEATSQPMEISTEVALSSQQSTVLSTSFGRELCFASSHLTHHLALMAVIAKMAGKDVDPTLGLAPATASYVREQEVAVCAR